MILFFTIVDYEYNKADIDGYIHGISLGDEKALSELYRVTGKAVYAYAVSLLKNTQDAEDVLHETYLSVCRSAAGYTSCGKPMAWIFTITRNLCLKLLGERSRTADIPDEDIAAFIPSKEDMTVEDRLVLYECLEKLDSTERQIVLLHAVCGFKHRETASLLGLRLPTVLSKYNRAIKKLKTILEESK